MHIAVRFFAVLRELAQTSETELNIASPATVAQAADQLCERFPQLRPWIPRIAYAVNRSYVPANTVLAEGDELVLIPPVSGG